MKPTSLIKFLVTSVFAASTAWADSTNLTPLASLHASPVTANEQIGFNVAVSGRYVVSGSTVTRTVRVFDSISGEQVRAFASPSVETTDRFGFSCAISGDYVVVGAPEATGSPGIYLSGKVYVFSLKTGKLVFELFPSGAFVIPHGLFGYSVAVSGRFIIVGAPSDDMIGKDVGAVYVFDTKTGQRLHKLSNTNSALHQQIGLNVAVDGNLIVASGGIADPGVQLNPSGDIFNPLPNPDPSNSKVGKVYVWNATNGTALSVLLDDDEIQTDDFGRSISIADGIVAVGEPFEKVGNVIVGAAHLYNATNGAHLRKLLPSNVSIEGRFGWGVASDGRNVVVSDPSANRLRVFSISSGEEVEDLTYGASGIRLGYKIAMDGDLLAAGAVYDSSEKQSGGSIQLFEHSRVTEGAGRWGAAVTAASGKVVTGSPDYQWGNQLLAGSATHFRASTGTYQSLTFPGGTLAEDHFGTSVGMDLNYTAVGSPGKDRSLFTNAGLVYVFGSQAAGYIHTLVPDKVQANAQFGAALDLNDGRVIVGAPGANGSKGAAYLYNPYSTNLLHKFEAPTGNAGDRLGQSVSVALSASRGGANLAVIGIPQDNNTKGTDAGRVDIYSALTGTLIKSLTSDKVDAGAKFGTAVVVREKILAIGAPKANHGGSNTGSVFVYDAKSLALRYVLTGGASANANGGFGSAIATDGRLIAVGAPNDDEIRPGAGAVYLFRATDGLLLRKFAVNLGNDSAHLGMSIALERGKVIVGAPDHDRLLAVAPGVTFPLVDAGATVEFDVKALLSDSNLFAGEPQIISQTTKEIKAIAPVFRGYVLEYSTNEANWYFLGAYEGAGQQQTIQIPSGIVAKYIRARGL